MLTIKHIIWDGDFETLYQAKEVRTKYRDRLSSNEPRVIQFVAFDLPNSDVKTIEFGKVYVMNEAGRTVGSYDFGAGWEPKHVKPMSPSYPADAAGQSFTITVDPNAVAGVGIPT